MSDILEDLSEEELCLYLILQDRSGIDQAEFSWHDATTEDGVWRAWPFQRSWWRDNSKYNISQGSRSLGKSVSIRARAYAFPFCFPNNEMVITAPEGIHLKAVTDEVEKLFLNNRLGREMLAGGGNSRTNGITHKPFKMTFQNGASINGRIPQHDGRGLKGMHPIVLEMDEAQDFPDAGWNEILETLKQGQDKAQWRAHGVTRGIRDRFWEYTQPYSDWTVFHFPAMWRPTWTDEEREEKIALYGSRQAPDYRRNILGEHGDNTSALFVLSTLMQQVDQDQGSSYNSSEYQLLRITTEQIADAVSPETLCELTINQSAYKSFWVGMDIGFTVSPSAILIFGEESYEKSKPTRLKLLSRIMLERVKAPDQATIVMHIIRMLMPKIQAFSMDKHGIGLPLYQIIQERAEQDVHAKRMLEIIKGYSWSEKLLVDLDTSVEIDPRKDDQLKEAGMERNALEHASDMARKMVDEKRLYLPWDKDLIGEFQGHVWAYDKVKTDMYGRNRRFSKGAHSLDAVKFAVLAYSMAPMEEIIKNAKAKKFVPVTPSFLNY